MGGDHGCWRMRRWKDEVGMKGEKRRRETKCRPERKGVSKRGDPTRRCCLLDDTKGRRPIDFPFVLGDESPPSLRLTARLFLLPLQTSESRRQAGENLGTRRHASQALTFPSPRGLCPPSSILLSHFPLMRRENWKLLPPSATRPALLALPLLWNA